RLWHIVDGDPPPLPGLSSGARAGRLHRAAHRGAQRPLPRRRGANDCRPRPHLAEAASPAWLTSSARLTCRITSPAVITPPGATGSPAVRSARMTQVLQVLNR